MLKNYSLVCIKMYPVIYLPHSLRVNTSVVEYIKIWLCYIYKRAYSSNE